MSDLSQLSDADVLRMLGEPNRQTPPKAVPRMDTETAAREGAAAAAAEEPSNPVVGLGSVEQRIINGGAQGFLKARKALSPSDSNVDTAINDLAAEQTDNSIRDKAYAKQNPNAFAFGESLPTLAFGATNAGQMDRQVLRGLERMDLPNILKGAIPGLAAYGSADEKLREAGVGGLATGAGSFLGGTSRKYLNPDLSNVQRETLREGRARGIYPRLSQVTKSPMIEGAEDWAARMPLGHGVSGAFDDQNARGFNRIGAEAMGEVPDAAGQVGPEVFASAKRNIKAPYQEVDRLPNPGGVPPINVGPSVAAAASDVLHRQTLRLTPDPVLNDIAQQALNAAQSGGRMTGESYQALRSELSDKLFDATGKTRTDYQILLDAIDSAADSSLRQNGMGDLADRLLTARSQYGNFKTLEGGRVAEGGNINPARVAQSVRTNNPDAFRTGRIDGTPLGFLSRWSELFPALRVGSQTAGREASANVARDPITLGTLGLPAAAVSKITTSPVTTTFPARFGGTPVGSAAANAIEPTIAGSVQSLIRRFMRPQTP